MQRSPFRNSLTPSRRHRRQTGPVYRAIVVRSSSSGYAWVWSASQKNHRRQTSLRCPAWFIDCSSLSAPWPVARAYVARFWRLAVTIYRPPRHQPQRQQARTNSRFIQKAPSRASSRGVQREATRGSSGLHTFPARLATQSLTSQSRTARTKAGLANTHSRSLDAHLSCNFRQTAPEQRMPVSVIGNPGISIMQRRTSASRQRNHPASVGSRRHS